MLRKSVGFVGVSLVGAALASSAVAQDANVTSVAKSAKLGGELRTELNYHDHGLDKADGFTPDKTTTIQLQAANLKLHGNLNDNTEYGFRFSLLGTGLEYGYGTHWLNKMIGVSVGRMRVHQGGWDNMDSSYRTHATGVYADNLVYKSYDDMIALHVMAGGKITLQVLNDVSTQSGDGEWNTSRHPTWALGWMGDFGVVKPLVDIGSYDNNKSRWIDVGVKTDLNGLVATLDFYQNTLVHKATGTDGKAKEVSDNATSITLNVAYEIKGVATPWVYYSTYDNKQGADSSVVPPRSDAKFNSVAVVNGTAQRSWADNGMVWGVGADLHTMGKGWTPYLAIVSRSGKFPDPKKPTEPETKSEMEVKLGVLGEI